MALLIATGKMRVIPQRGFTYLAVLLLVFVLLLIVGAASENIATINKREREVELIFIGQQYRNAIASYYYNSPGGIKQLPFTLEDMLLDKRSVNPMRHLRKIFQDPITDTKEWGLVKSPQGEITGVYSLSNDEVLATINNSSLSESSQLGESSANLKPSIYSNWKFIFKPENQDSSLINDSAADENTDKNEDKIGLD